MKNKRPRIFFIALPYSIHSARWISQLEDQNWEIFLFPSQKSHLNSQFKKIEYFSPSYFRQKNINRSVKWRRWTSFAFYIDLVFKKILKKDNYEKFQKLALFWALKVVQPDIIHILEIQHAGYLYFDMAKERAFLQNQKVIVSVWGSDLFLFGRLEDHLPRIQKVLEKTDYLITESERDDKLAISYGFTGKLLPNIQSTGGVDFSKIQPHIHNAPSQRKGIILKGYEHWAGRALFGLAALKRCKVITNDYKIFIISATPDVLIAAELFSQETGITTVLIPEIDQQEIYKLYASSRIYIGISISDGIPNSLIEAMSMGAFPIQSSSASIDGWIRDGSNGFVVPSDDIIYISEKITKALTDDRLVDYAAQINNEIIKEKLDYKKTNKRIVNTYKEVLFGERFKPGL